MEIRVFCFRASGFYGFGLTPEQAVNQACKAGFNRKFISRGFMHRLPAGVTEASVDVYGMLVWNRSEQLTEMIYVKKQWVDKP